MRQYKIFVHPAGILEAVKIGWSWPAFFFSIVWALTKKMWLIASGTLLIAIVFGLFLAFFHVSDDQASLLLDISGLIANLIFGAKGNSWRMDKLLDRGFDDADTVTAANKDGAIALFLKDQRTIPASTSAR